MVNISHVVKKIVSENALMAEMLSKGIISHVHFAESIQEDVIKELRRPVELPAIIMALRRHQEEIQTKEKSISPLKFEGQIIIKTNIVDYNVEKSPSLISAIKKIYNTLKFEQGDDFNTIIGSNEVSIIFNEKFNPQIKKLLEGERILIVEKNLVSLTIRFSKADFLHTPGAIFSAVRKLAFEQINIFEIVSTMTELTFILHKDDSMKAYGVLQKMLN